MLCVDTYVALYLRLYPLPRTRGQRCGKTAAPILRASIKIAASARRAVARGFTLRFIRWGHTRCSETSIATCCLDACPLTGRLLSMGNAEGGVTITEMARPLLQLPIWGKRKIQVWPPQRREQWQARSAGKIWMEITEVRFESSHFILFGV